MRPRLGRSSQTARRACSQVAGMTRRAAKETHNGSYVRVNIQRHHFNEKQANDRYQVNNRGAVDYCLFGRFAEESNDDISSTEPYKQCFSACNPIYAASDYRVKSDPESYSYCDSNGNYTSDAQNCIKCLYDGKGLTILGNSKFSIHRCFTKKCALTICKSRSNSNRALQYQTRQEHRLRRGHLQHHADQALRRLPKLHIHLPPPCLTFRLQLQSLQRRTGRHCPRRPRRHRGSPGRHPFPTPTRSKPPRKQDHRDVRQWNERGRDPKLFVPVYPRPGPKVCAQ